MPAALVLRRARCFTGSGETAPREVAIADGAVREAAPPAAESSEIDLDGRILLPAFVNAHDVLDLAPLPPFADRRFASVYEWTRASESEFHKFAPALAIPLADRLFLGGVRNLLAGVAAVLHHHPYHRSLDRPDFPVRVQGRYGFAHSPGLTKALRRTYRTTDRRIPWVVRAAEGADPALRGELDLLAAANVLRQNTVIAHGTALEAEDAPRLAAAKACLAWCPESDLRLYGRTLAARAFEAAGVRVGLGSDGAPAGARDYLSSLAAARREGGFGEAALVALATQASGEVARLPVGGFDLGASADLLATESLERLFAGDRRAISLLVVRGRVVYGDAELVPDDGKYLPVVVDGEPRVLAGELGRRLGSLLRRHPAAGGACWLAGVAI